MHYVSWSSRLLPELPQVPHVHPLLSLHQVIRLENLDTESQEQFHHFSAQIPFDNSTKIKDKTTQKV